MYESLTCLIRSGEPSDVCPAEVRWATGGLPVVFVDPRLEGMVSALFSTTSFDRW